jgi:large subunit ribosomal protein L15
MSMTHEITARTPRNKHSQRKGRGESSGRGKTCGRGNKGAKARTGTYIKRGHEGGQTPLFRRFPKRGFSNFDFERRFHIVNLTDVVANFDSGATVDAAALIEAGLVPDDKQPVKILGEGAIDKKLTIIGGWFSKSAHQKILDAGGSPQNLKGEVFAFPKPKKKFVKREAVKKVKAEDTAAGDAPKVAEGAEKPAAETKPAAE